MAGGTKVAAAACAESIGSIIENAMLPENSWKVVLDNVKDPAKKRSGEVVWIGTRDGGQVRLAHEPDTTWFRRLGVGFYFLFPLKERI